jgi:hypothetical protein
MEKELALKRDARQFSDTKMVDTAISSSKTVHPPDRQTDAQENDEAQDCEPEHQVAYPAGRQFHGSLPFRRPEAEARNSATSTRTAKCPGVASAPVPNSSALLPTAERPGCPSKTWRDRRGLRAARAVPSQKEA